MFDKFKYVWKRFTAKVDGNLAKDESTDWSEIERTRERLARLKSRNGSSTTTGSYDLASVRKRITQEMETGNCDTIRKRDSQAINKWFRGDEITDSGSFDTVELNRRIVEMRRVEQEADPVVLDSFPDMEDTFLAFSKPEEDLFDDDERITLSGVNYQVDPMEELEDEYTLPGIPMFHDDAAVAVNELDLDIAVNHTIDFSPEADNKKSNSDAVKQNPAGSHEGAKPAREILASLEARLAQGRGKGNFWVDSGY
ncbi:hypothetical protein GC174_00690 [bacterium]|nr:hypothetical protein [bacterium]